MIKKFVEHNGLSFKSYNTPEKFDGVLTFIDNKLILNGFVSFTLMSGSYKYPDQFILKVFTDKPVKTEKAVNNNYNTVEIALNKSYLLDFIKDAIKDGVLKYEDFKE